MIPPHYWCCRILFYQSLISNYDTKKTKYVLFYNIAPILHTTYLENKRNAWRFTLLILKFAQILDIYESFYVSVNYMRHD